MSSNEDVTVTEKGVTLSLSMESYIKLTNLGLCSVALNKFIPSPTFVTFNVEEPDIVVEGCTNYPDIKVILHYDGFRVEKNPRGLTKIANEIKNAGIQRQVGSSPEFLTRGDTIYLAPWCIGDVFDTKRYLEMSDYTFWSSIYCKLPILDIVETNVSFRQGIKYSLSETFDDETSVLRKYMLQDDDVQMMKEYGELEYKFQDGRTHIWMNDKVVIKLSFHMVLGMHEIDVLNMGLQCLPQLLKWWKSEISGVFIVMTNCGNTLSHEYVFPSLYPESVMSQKEEIRNILAQHGLVHLDDHSHNYVVKDGKLTMIDCEVIVDIGDKEAYENNKIDHNYVFPLLYYKTIFRSWFPQ